MSCDTFWVYFYNLYLALVCAPNSATAEDAKKHMDEKYPLLELERWRISTTDERCEDNCDCQHFRAEITR